MAQGKTKGAESKTRTACLVRVVCERISGKVADSYHNGAMDHGIAQEPYALMAYEARTGNLVIESEFVEHGIVCPLSGFVAPYGASPDGLIEPDGGVEIKCPEKTHVHIDTILRSRMPPEHRPQVQGNMLATGRAWWDFVSYSPNLPDHLQLYIERIPRHEAYIATLRTAIIRFCNEVDEMVERLNRRAA